MIIDAGTELEHAKVLIAAKNLATSLEQDVEVRFVVGPWNGPCYQIVHCIRQLPTTPGVYIVAEINVYPIDYKV